LNEKRKPNEQQEIKQEPQDEPHIEIPLTDGHKIKSVAAIDYFILILALMHYGPELIFFSKKCLSLFS
jgi:hypothetical protein